MALHLLGFLPMHFPTRLIQLRKAANFTQQTLPGAAELHVSLDSLVIEEDLRLRVEALAQLDSNEGMVVKELLDGMLLKHEARRLVGAAV
jgi:hypothetical protein